MLNVATRVEFELLYQRYEHQKRRVHVIVLLPKSGHMITTLRPTYSRACDQYVRVNDSFMYFRIVRRRTF